MNITVVELINYLKFQLSTGLNTDPVVATITDDEIDVIIKMNCGTLDLEYPTIPYSYMQLMSCLARKDLYWKLATHSAPFTALTSGDTELNKNQRFDHYADLIKGVSDEYNNIMNDPSRLPEDFAKGKIQAHTTLLQKDYVLTGYVNNYKLPKINLKVDNVNVEDNNIEVTLDLTKVKASDYVRTSIYLNEASKIVDEYATESLVSKDTRLIYQTYDIRKDKLRIACKLDNLDKPKYILLVAELKYGLKAYYELEVIV